MKIKKLTSIWVTVFVCLRILPICKKKKCEKKNIRHWTNGMPQFMKCVHMFVLISLEVEASANVRDLLCKCASM